MARLQGHESSTASGSRLSKWAFWLSLLNLVLLALIGTFVLLGLRGPGAKGSIDQLATSIGSLEERLIANESRIKIVEDRATATAELTASAGLTRAAPLTRSSALALPPAQDRQNWRQLRKGMDKEEVQRLLGQPAQVSSTDTLETWYYDGSRHTHARTIFDSDGQLYGWQDP